MIPYRQGRVSPVLDVAGKFLLVTLEQGQETTRENLSLEVAGALGRAQQISLLGVDVVICGAVSPPLELALRSAVVPVLPNICGEVDDVVLALINGRLSEDAYMMPECRGRRRHVQAERQGAAYAGGHGGKTVPGNDRQDSTPFTGYLTA